MPAKYVALAGAAVHYLHTGATTLPDVPPALDRGRLFVLVHAAGSTAGLWRRQLDGLAERHSAVALDFPGHGRSHGVEGLPTIAAYADCLVRFAEALRLRPFVLVGRSMGGAAGLVVAHERPDLLAGLVLVCSAARFTLPDAMIDSVRDVARGRLPQQFTTETFSPATGPEIMREAWTEQVRTDPRVRLGDLLACRAFDGRGLLAGIRVPTLVVAGADDQVTPVAQSEELARGIPGARLEVLAQAGHQAPLEQSAAFNRLVTEFAEGLG
ncbi:MAG TPA: alpha/beta fold hydrolase [Candidatus Binatia bacterium]|nr:alpha/beta fold hydrolase [Candidatus Binatia bacterium]